MASWARTRRRPPWRMASMALAMRLLRTWRMSFSKQRMVVRGGVGGFDVDAGVGEAALVEVEDGVDEIGCADVGGADGLAVEAEGLGGDLADTGEFALRNVDVGLMVSGRSWDQSDEIEEVGDGLEWVVDLVGDGAGQAANGGELFALDESGLGFFLVGHLEDDGGDGFDGAVAVGDGGVADVPEAMFAGASGELAFEEMVPDGMTLGGLLEDFFEAFEGSDLGDGAADDLLLGKTDVSA